MIREVWKLTKTGSMDNLKKESEKLKNMDDYEEPIIRIKVKAIGLNFADVFSILGLYKFAAKTNLIPGFEFSGIIQEFSKNSFIHNNQDLKLGDHVMGIIKFGAYSNIIDADIKYVKKLPKNWTFEEGASYIAQSLTAYYSIKFLANINKDCTVLIHSIAGGVGLYCLKILRKLNYNINIVGTVGSQNKLEMLKKLKIYNDKEKLVVINRNDENYVHLLKKSLNKFNSKGFDYILDSLAGPYFGISMQYINPQSRIVCIGSGHLMPSFSSISNLKILLSSPYSIIKAIRLMYDFLTRPKIDILDLIDKNYSVMGFDLIKLFEDYEFLNSMLNEVNDLGLEPPLIDQIFYFDDIIYAIKKLQSGKTMGKVVVTF